MKKIVKESLSEASDVELQLKAMKKKIKALLNELGADAFCQSKEAKRLQSDYSKLLKKREGAR
jgi:Txe/YoeB family toxin of Txe-Axe toxin-antitoxin module